MSVMYAYYSSALIARSLIYLVVLGRIEEYIHYIYKYICCNFCNIVVKRILVNCYIVWLIFLRM